MCIVAAKYFDNVGWVGIKNRDRNYKPQIAIKQSFRKGIERMYILDKKSKYTEGLNEHGICIISTTLSYKTPEEVVAKNKIERAKPGWCDGDGKGIRTALLESDITTAVDTIISHEIKGNTLVFNKDRCFLIEAYFKDKINQDKYTHTVREITKDQGQVVRTNHNVWLAGNKLTGIPTETAAIKSSKNRLDVTKKELSKISDWRDMFDALSNTDNENSQMNPMRITSNIGIYHMHTTGQLLVAPFDNTLHYRPIWGGIEYNFDKINSKKSKTFFEIVSSKNLVSKLSESLGTFKQWLEERNLIG